MKKIVIIGAGDGGHLVSQFVKEQDKLDIIGLIDDGDQLQGRTINGCKVIGKSTVLKKFSKVGFVISVGLNMPARRKLFDKAIKAGLKPVNLIHRSAVIDKTAKVGKGVIVLANSVINPFAKLGNNLFIFTGVIIEHNVRVGDNVYFSPGVSLAGHVKVGDNTFFGINSCVIEGITIGSNVIVGAGSVVLEDIPDYTVVAGAPARMLRKNYG